MANGGKISKAKAKKWVNNYKAKHGKDKNFLSSMLFDKKVVIDLLSEDKCEGLRVYNAIDDEGKEHFILVGTDAKGSNLLPSNEESLTESYSLLDEGKRCPTDCPPEGDL